MVHGVVRGGRRQWVGGGRRKEGVGKGVRLGEVERGGWKSRLLVVRREAGAVARY